MNKEGYKKLLEEVQGKLGFRKSETFFEMPENVLGEEWRVNTVRFISEWEDRFFNNNEINIPTLCIVLTKKLDEDETLYLYYHAFLDVQDKYMPADSSVLNLSFLKGEVKKKKKVEVISAFYVRDSGLPTFFKLERRIKKPFLWRTII